MAYDFLSDEWMDAIEGMRDEAPEPPVADLSRSLENPSPARLPSGGDRLRLPLLRLPPGGREDGDDDEFNLELDEILLLQPTSTAAPSSPPARASTSHRSPSVRMMTSRRRRIPASPFHQCCSTLTDQP